MAPSPATAAMVGTAQRIQQCLSTLLVMGVMAETAAGMAGTAATGAMVLSASAEGHSQVSDTGDTEEMEGLVKMVVATAALAGTAAPTAVARQVAGVAQAAMVARAWNLVLTSVNSSSGTEEWEGAAAMVDLQLHLSVAQAVAAAAAEQLAETAVPGEPAIGAGTGATVDARIRWVAEVGMAAGAGTQQLGSGEQVATAVTLVTHSSEEEGEMAETEAQLELV
ncbi:MAG: hypothetical protein ACR2GY_07800 [Phycisphaerales bacterium]